MKSNLNLSNYFGYYLKKIFPLEYRNINSLTMFYNIHNKFVTIENTKTYASEKFVMNYFVHKIL